MHLFLANCRPLHVGDPFCISRASSCARTYSIHSTRNLQVACGMKSVCQSPFLLVYLGDEFLLCKRSACKPCYFMEKINKKLFISGRFSMMSNTIYKKINVQRIKILLTFLGWIRILRMCSTQNQQSQIKAFFQASAITQLQSSDFCRNIIQTFSRSKCIL